jgi:hypothetical protein
MSLRKKDLSKNFFKTHTIPERVEEQISAIKLLLSQGYGVLDLEGNILHRDTIEKDVDSYHDSRPRYDYVNRYQKRKNEI